MVFFAILVFAMQIKDVHVIFHLLVTWFIQKCGKYARKAGGSVFFVKK